MYKKILLLIFSLICSWHTLNLHAAETKFSFNGINYRIANPETNDFCNLIKPNTGQTYAGDIEIPDSVEYQGKKYSVFVIDESAFNGCSELTSITIPQTVGVISQKAFNGCYKLKNVTFKDKQYATAIQFLNTASSGDYWIAFKDCPIENVYLGRELDLKGRAYSPFRENSSIRKLTVGPYVNTLPTYSFRNCTSLTQLIISDGKSPIKGSNIFANAPIEDVYLGRSIETSDFQTTLKTVICGESFSEIPASQFRGCSNLTNITLSGKLTKIGFSAFSECSSLTSLNLPDGIVEIASSAFKNCSSLEQITIPKSTTALSDALFSGCTNLTNVSLHDKITEIDDRAFFNCENLLEITMPQNLTRIGHSAFANCRSIVSLSIPNGVTNLENSAFSGCNNLKSVTMHSKIMRIGSYTFKDCQNLEITKLPSMLNSIGAETFAGCSKISEINIPVSVNTIGDKAFYKMSAKIKLHSCLSIENPNNSYACLSGIDNNSIVYAHRLEKENIEKYWSGKTIYFEDTDLTSSVELLAGVDFTLNSSSENLSFPIKNIICEMPKNNSQKPAITTLGSTSYAIRNLQPDEIYYVHISDQAGQHTYAFKTKMPTVNFKESSIRTQTKLGGTITASKDESIEPSCFILGEECKNGQAIVVSGLIPGNSYSLTGYANYNGKIFYAKNTIHTTTLGLMPKIICSATPTKLIFTGSYQKGDATVEMFGFTSSNNKNDFDGNMSMTISGLEPRASYTAYFGVKVAENYSPYRASLYGTTADVTWSEGDFTATSTKSVRLRVATNCDAETGTGIEWRRNDAPDNVKSTYVACPVVDGILVGSLRNLNPEVYYKFRPVYETQGGAKYYGTWTGFYSGDASVYFDPEVRTLDDIEIFENSALVASYVMPGSDDIKRQGIQYWRKGANQGRADESKMEFITSGIKSTVTLSDLQAGTEYAYRAFAETASRTIYGDEKNFVTKGTSGIDNIISNESDGLSIVLKENPARGQIQFSITGSTKSILEVSLLSMAGNIIRHKMCDTSSEWMVLDANCSSGVYLLMVNDGKACASTRVIIMN